MPTIDFIAGEEQEVTAVLAYRLWEKRGCPLGSPEVDWFEAKNQLATALAKSEALIALSAVGMEPNEGPWPPSEGSLISVNSRLGVKSRRRRCRVIKVAL